MTVRIFPQWKGFEFSPQGCLLEQVIDISGEVGFAYERSCGFYKDFHVHDRLMLIFPRGSSSMEVRTKNPRKSLTVNAESVLVVPKIVEHDDEGTSAVYDTMALYPSDALLEATARKLKLSEKNLQRLLGECIKIRRTKKLDQLASDYFFEKLLAKEAADAEGLEYLGRKILEEVLRTAFPELGNDKLELRSGTNEPTAIRAARYIELNLFEAIELGDIAKNSGASVSTLLRKFKAELGCTPYAYIKNRRLEEAALLLKTKAYSVGDVALLVGYENFGAFSDAFKLRYGKKPSSLKQ